MEKSKEKSTNCIDEMRSKEMHIYRGRESKGGVTLVGESRVEVWSIARGAWEARDATCPGGVLRVSWHEQQHAATYLLFGTGFNVRPGPPGRR